MNPMIPASKRTSSVVREQTAEDQTDLQGTTTRWTDHRNTRPSMVR